MLWFILRRLGHGLLIILAVSFVTFFLMNKSPGSYLDAMRLDPQIPPEFIDAERERLGLDKPWIVTYLLWLKGVVTELNFGKSFAHKLPVFDVMAPRVLNTLLLSVCSIGFAWLVAIPLGIIAGARQYSVFDKLASTASFIWISIPDAFLALVAIYFAAVSGLFPTAGLTDPRVWDSLNPLQRAVHLGWHLVLPTLVLGSAMTAGLMRQMRGNLLDVLRADYVRTARAKGVGEAAVLLKHASRNAINPLITLFGFSLSSLLSGAVLVEQIMSYPGLGRLVVKAMFDKDVYLVIAAVVTATAMLVLGNLIADIMLAWSDPRIKLEDRPTT